MAVSNKEDGFIALVVDNLQETFEFILGKIFDGFNIWHVSIIAQNIPFEQCTHSNSQLIS